MKLNRFKLLDFVFKLLKVNQEAYMSYWHSKQEYISWKHVNCRCHYEGNEIND